jgi:hypothetical protein
VVIYRYIYNIAVIPKFPQFKDLEVSDKTFIESVTSKYAPYCDFNFEIMWAWDFNKSAKISQLNNNLVLLQKNIFTNKMVASFLGNNKLDDTIAELFEFLDSTGIKKPSLSLLPEDSLKGINFKKYFIEIDLPSCDYIYDLKQLSEFLGHGYSKKRGKFNSFLRNYPNVTIKNLDLKTKEVQDQILSLNNYWAQNKSLIDIEEFNENELRAIKRFLEGNFENTYCLGVYDEKLIGYSIFSYAPDGYVIGHFTKADISYKGIYEFIMNSSAKSLVEMGYKLLNYQEDMGLPGLRAAKISYRPIRFLRKYFLRRL